MLHKKIDNSLISLSLDGRLISTLNKCYPSFLGCHPSLIGIFLCLNDKKNKKKDSEQVGMKKDYKGISYES